MTARAVSAPKADVITPPTTTFGDRQQMFAAAPGQTKLLILKAMLPAMMITAVFPLRSVISGLITIHMSQLALMVLLT